MRCWSLLSISGGRQYGGNDGYVDSPETMYRYDSSVANSRQLSEGDLVVIRNRSKVLGTAFVERISSEEGTKRRNRCPVCKIPAIKHRATKVPAWRCNNGHEFDAPDSADVSVTNFEAFYGETFVRLQRSPTPSHLKSAALRPNDQISIEELDVNRLETVLAEYLPPDSTVLGSIVVRRGIDAHDAASYPSDYQPNLSDRRDIVLRAIKERRGQKKFRLALIRRYGPICLITGCGLLDVLEAAHIWPHRGDDDNHVQNGLLLRADLHTLFDLNLLGIEPESMKVTLREVVRLAGYEQFDSQTLRVMGPRRPSRAALALRWTEFNRL
jgi:hypothetical protein